MRPIAARTRNPQVVAASLALVACNGSAEDDCPRWSEPAVVGTIEEGDIEEPSGLVVSPLEPDVLWTHNDAGDDARLFALSPSGALLREYRVSEVAMGDWEDVALVGDTLWIGDLGTDAGSPALLVGVPLPLVGAGDTDPGVLGPDSVLGVTFPDARTDVEAIFYDVPSERMVLVSRAVGDLTHVYAVDLGDGAATTIATLAFGSGALEGDREVTGGASTTDGSAFALRTRTTAFLWTRGSGELGDALDADPCPIPVDGTSGGEAIAFDGDDAVYLMGDGAGAPIVHAAK